MKRFISLTALLLSISLFLYHGTSFSSAEIKNGAILSIVPEENALIAVTYGEGGNFSVINNTAKAIVVVNVEVVNEHGQPVTSIAQKVPFTLNPGDSQKLTIKGDPKILTGIVIQLTARWNGGSARINSIIPKLVGQSEVEESIEESIEENSEPTEADVDNINQDKNKEENVVEEDEEIVEPPIDSAGEDEIVDSDTDDAIVEPEIDEDK
ncbi:hypothetical protein JSQ81_08550 [Sporosarcina sp. Marseille-Q4063]|uniref:hypothetical protein n=1 Tax=Sporosarcina sp. Marseille-Q4063 TaxID=2810514 RepID=UPI001BB09969|nr:hypothetical protein [Sporosarcina sp. Marseille-Q4063]QUW23534.1 hypothetical protein JSQ81_08550 [Sporosarcina sp. Marseille-Q4063]